MSNESEAALEKLTEFLYIVPVGLLEFDTGGQIYLANPRITQIFNPFSMTGMVSNIFDILRPQLPELIEEILAFQSHSGVVLDNKRIFLQAPLGPSLEHGTEDLVLDFTVIKQHNSRFYASVNNVTEQTKLMRENIINNHRLDAIHNHVDGYGMFTLDASGQINSWNGSAAKVIKVENGSAIGKHYAEVMGLEGGQGKALLETSKQTGWVSFKNPTSAESDTLVSVIREPDGHVLGYSVIVRDHESGSASAPQ